jgi:type IV secretory pathway TraG/TraD family ATPase VirD4
MKNIQVFEGHELRQTPPTLRTADTRCRLLGIDSSGGEVFVPLDDDLFSRHMLFLGGIGTGKTNAIFQILHQLRKSMTPNDVMLIFDTKGDYHQEFYRDGDIVISNDDKASGPAGPNYWNIFREVGQGEELEENFNEITRTLFHEQAQRSNQPFFPNAARDLLTAILLHFSRSNSQANRDNAHLRSFLDQTHPAELRNILENYDDLKAITSYIADDRSPQTQGVISELQNMVRDILVGNFCRAGGLSVREAIRGKGGRAIFIEYDLGIGSVLTPVYRLLLDLALKEALCRRKSEGNVWFVVDEFRLVPNLQHVDDGINFGRSLGAKFIVGVQNVEQVFHAYGESLARSILSGFMTTVAFRVNDATTRNFIQGLFGRNRKRESYASSIPGRGLAEQVHEANVVEDWDIANLPLGRAIIGLPNQEPFLFQFKRYM